MLSGRLGSGGRAEVGNLNQIDKDTGGGGGGDDDCGYDDNDDDNRQP